MPKADQEPDLCPTETDNDATELAVLALNRYPTLECHNELNVVKFPEFAADPSTKTLPEAFF